MNSRKIAFNADDFGLSLGFNEGILEAAKHGLLGSTSIRVNGSAYRDAVDRVLPQIPSIKVGLHLNIVEGKSTRKNILLNEILCNQDGGYKLGFIGLLVKSLYSKRLLKEIEIDFRNQIEIALKDFKKLDHLNSHQHSHLIPSIFSLTCRLAKEYDISIIRSPKENYYFIQNFFSNLRLWYLVNLIKLVVVNSFEKINRSKIKRFGLNSPDHFVGILHTGHMNFSTVAKGVAANSIQNGVTEILIHPAKIMGIKDEIFLNKEVRDYVVNLARHDEINLVTNSNLYNHALKHRWVFTNLAGDKLENISLPVKCSSRTKSALRTVLIMDESPFYQPTYCKNLIEKCEDIRIVGIVIVSLPGGGKLQSYLIKHWQYLGIKSLIMLGFKYFALSLLGYLPKKIRGDFSGQIKSLAVENKIPYKVARNADSEKFRVWVENFSPELIISSNSTIFKKNFIDVPSTAFLNRHSSLLPAYGGILPVFRAIQNDEAYTGASIHSVVEKIDGGAVISQKALRIFAGDTVDGLYKLCFTLSYIATIEAITKIRKDTFYDQHITTAHPCYFSYPNKSDWHIFNSKKIPFI